MQPWNIRSVCNPRNGGEVNYLLAVLEGLGAGLARSGHNVVGSVLDVGFIAGHNSAEGQSKKAHKDEHDGESLHVVEGKTCLSVCCV